MNKKQRLYIICQSYYFIKKWSKMKILKIDEKNNFVSIVPEILDDLWHLERILEKDDLVSGSTTRKLKAKEGEEIRRIHMWLQLGVEEVEFHKFSGQLRVSGTIITGKPAEFVEEKSHHTLSFDLGEKIDIQKKKLKKYQIERLEKAQKATHKEKLLTVLLDDEDASFFLLKEFGIDNRGIIRSKRSGKQIEEGDWKKEYFSEILKKLKEIDSKKIMIAGPGFEKEELKKYLEEKEFLGKERKAFIESTGTAGMQGLQELMKTEKLQKIIEESQILKENKLMEKVMQELGKSSGLVEYGISEVENALNLGAVEELLVLDKSLLENREKIEELMKKCEEIKGNVNIFSAEHEAGKQLDGFGGVIALLRYRIK